MAMKVTLWGIRGSLPSPMTPAAVTARVRHVLEAFGAARKSNPQLTPQDYLERLPVDQLGGFGGHTACIQVATPQTSLIIDGGSGIRRLGEQLMLGACGMGRGEVHILMTHFHWDHLIGLPFFVPMFIPGNTIHFYGVQDDLEENIRAMFTKPRFPVPFEALGSRIVFHKLSPRMAVDFGDMRVTPYQLDHPDPCWGYRFEHENKVFSYCVDSECTRMSAKDLGPDLPLYQGVDVMIFDAQYTFIEATEKINWGHSSGPIGVDLAVREKVKRLYFIHHDPAASDQKILKAEQQTRDYYNSLRKQAEVYKEPFHEVDWCFAREGMVIDV